MSNSLDVSDKTGRTVGPFGRPVKVTLVIVPLQTGNPILSRALPAVNAVAFCACEDEMTAPTKTPSTNFLMITKADSILTRQGTAVEASETGRVEPGIEKRGHEGGSG